MTIRPSGCLVLKVFVQKCNIKEDQKVRDFEQFHWRRDIFVGLPYRPISFTSGQAIWEPQMIQCHILRRTNLLGDVDSHIALLEIAIRTTIIMPLNYGR
jgi:hypothetical protein